MQRRDEDGPPSDSDGVRLPQKRFSSSPKVIQKMSFSSPKRVMIMRRFQKTLSRGSSTRQMILRPDPEMIPRRPHDYVVSEVTPEYRAVSSNIAVAIPKLSVRQSLALFCSDAMKRLSGDPVLERQPPFCLTIPVVFLQVKMQSPCQNRRQC